MRRYTSAAGQIREILHGFTPLVEPLSLDEAFLDVRGCEGLFGTAPEMARRLKQRVREETGLVASVGVAPNKFLAKLASDHGKSDGLVVLVPEEVLPFLHPLPISRLWGVGRRGEARLHALGVRSVGQLAALLLLGDGSYNVADEQLPGRQGLPRTLEPGAAVSLRGPDRCQDAAVLQADDDVPGLVDGHGDERVLLGKRERHGR